MDNQSEFGAAHEQKSEPPKRGFAAMDQAARREIARKGGQAAHRNGSAHEFNAEEARLAGQKGGAAVSRDRAHMAEIGRQGGLRRHAKRDGEDPGAKP